MLKLILTKSVTVATAATIAAGMAIFMTVAPQAKAPPQATSAVVEHVLAKGDRLRPLVKGAACSATELAKLRANLSVRPAHLGRSRPPGADARFGEGTHPAQRRHRLALSIQRTR